MDAGVQAPNLAAHGVARVVRAACRPNCDNGDFPERIERRHDILRAADAESDGLKTELARGVLNFGFLANR